MKKIGFIGCGNMASAIIGGIIGSGKVEADEIIAADPLEETRARAAETHGISVTADNAEAARSSRILFLAVKPQMMDMVAEQIRGSLRREQILVSILAGVSIGKLEECFPAEPGMLRKIVRLMPNTPALVGAGMTAACCSISVSTDEFAGICSLCESFGEVEVLPERLFDAVTALSGSSPATVFVLLEALADGAVACGMPRQQAYRMAAQTVLGSARLRTETGRHPAALKDMVTSPAGTTAEALRVLEKCGFRSAVIESVEAAAERSSRLA